MRRTLSLGVELHGSAGAFKRQSPGGGEGGSPQARAYVIAIQIFLRGFAGKPQPPINKPKKSRKRF
jgi:hypothetical protein